jgi:hypothetical protein
MTLILTTVVSESFVMDLFSAAAPTLNDDLMKLIKLFADVSYEFL